MSALRTSCVLTLGLLLGVGPALSAARDVGERQLKAATIVSMLRLVTWRAPVRAGAPIVVAVVGDGALADALREAAADQRVDGRALTVSDVSTLAELGEPTAAVVVLSAAHRASAQALARSIGHKQILTIGEGDGMSEAGLVIGVYVDGQRIRFDANTGAAARAGLSLSSHLLRLARIVG